MAQQFAEIDVGGTTFGGFLGTIFLIDFFLGMFPPGGVDVAHGQDLNILRQKAGQVQRALSHVNGVASAQVELQEDVPQVQVSVNLASAQRYGIKPGDVRRAAATLDSLEPTGGLEPPTCGLRNRCSTD